MRTLPETANESIGFDDDVLVRCPSVANEVSLMSTDLSALFQPVSIERALKFVHVFANRPVTEDVVTHYHLAPTVSDEVTVGTLTALFDVVCERDEGREISRSAVPTANGCGG